MSAVEQKPPKHAPFWYGKKKKIYFLKEIHIQEHMQCVDSDAMLLILFQKAMKALNWLKLLMTYFGISLSLLQAWLTVRCWSRWSEGTVCPAPRGAPSPCTRWWNSAGRRTRTKDPRSSTCSPSWRTISQPQSHSTNLGKTYSLACVPQTLRQLEAAPIN